jgi:putative nucleotidyltransferase with HDIG domain
MSKNSQVAAADPKAETRLSPFPPVANALIALAGRDDVSLADVTEVLAIDAAISTEVLRLANSGFVGVRGEVSSITQAAAILGLKRVSALAATIALRGAFGALWQTPVVQQCWHHNLASALTAEAMAHALGVDPNSAYTAGLLHDIGRLAMIVEHRQKYIRMLRTPPPPGSDYRALERLEFKVDHTEVGGDIAESLELPRAITDAVRHHHEPPTSDGGMTTFAHVACGIATAMGFGVTGVEKPKPNPDAADAVIGMIPEPHRQKLRNQRERLFTDIPELLAAYDNALS